MSSIGTDPEYLLYSDDLSTYIPSIGLLGGTKDAPKSVDGGAVQEDNVTAEINIVPVSLDDADGFVANINKVRQYVDNLVSGFGLRTVAEASAAYSEDYLSHPQAMQSGCDPDMNAYTGRQNEYPDISESNFRCAGGHIHYGNPDIFADPGSREAFIKYCDYYVGAPLSLIDPDTVRRATYGAAGNFRYKPYGVEYRTPSNIWLKSEGLMRFVVRRMQRAEQAFIANERRPLMLAEQFLSHSISAGNHEITEQVIGSRIAEEVRSLA